MKSAERAQGEAASQKITEWLEELGGWRAQALARVRRLIHEADPEIQEEWKWRRNAGIRCGRTAAAFVPAKRTSRR